MEVPKFIYDLELYAKDEKFVKRVSELIRHWGKTYKHVNVEAEIRKAHTWEVCNPSKRKKDRAKFLNNWLNRADTNNAARSGSLRETLAVRNDDLSDLE